MSFTYFQGREGPCKFKKPLRLGTDGIANHLLTIAFPIVGQSIRNFSYLSIPISVFLDGWKVVGDYSDVRPYVP